MLHEVSPDSPWVFITAAASLIPLAGLIGLGTEQLARRSGPAWGGFLNATFGNAAELIIALVALRNGHIELVKASITGSIVGNLLLVLGLSFFVGGIGRDPRSSIAPAATNATAMLFLGVVALVMPAVFDLSLYGNLAARPPAIDRLSFWSALILIVAYARQPDLRVHRAARSVPARPRCRASEPRRATLTTTAGDRRCSASAPC